MKCLMPNENLIRFLNQLLSNYFVMYVKLHRYHWYIQGNNFYQFQEQFTEMHKMFAHELEILAERILAINGQPLATMVKYVKEATLDEANADNVEDEIMMQLIKDFEQMIAEIHVDGLRYAQEINDESTIDLLITFQKNLEKHLWMLKAQQT